MDISPECGDDWVLLGLSEFHEELTISPDHSMARLQIALLMMQHFNQPQEALALTRAAVKLEPESFAPHWVLGRILLKLNQADAAIRELEVAAKLAPDSVPIHHTLLNAYNKAKRKEDAARVEEILQRLQAFEAAHKPRAEPARIEAGESDNLAPSLPP